MDVYAVITHLVVLTSKHLNDKIYEVTHDVERKNNDWKRILEYETACMQLQINSALINSVVSARLLDPVLCTELERKYHIIREIHNKCNKFYERYTKDEM